jgi:hypothetical protein
MTRIACLFYISAISAIRGNFFPYHSPHAQGINP